MGPKDVFCFWTKNIWFLLCKEPKNIFDRLKLQHTHQNVLHMFLLGTIGMPGF